MRCSKKRTGRGYARKSPPNRSNPSGAPGGQHLKPDNPTASPISSAPASPSSGSCTPHLSHSQSLAHSAGPLPHHQTHTWVCQSSLQSVLLSVTLTSLDHTASRTLIESPSHPESLLHKHGVFLKSLAHSQSHPQPLGFTHMQYPSRPGSLSLSHTHTYTHNLMLANCKAL